MTGTVVFQPLREPLHDGKKLSWECQVNICGEKVEDPMIHSCELCDNPILVYGRLVPCKHVFCFDCAEHNCDVCPRCNDPIDHIEMAKVGSVFLCTFGAPRHSHKGCRRTYLSQRDLMAHIGHRHGAPAVEVPQSRPASSSNSSFPTVGSVKQISPSVQNPEYSINTCMTGRPISSITSSTVTNVLPPTAADYQPIHRHSAPVPQAPQTWLPRQPHHTVVTIPPRAPPPSGNMTIPSSANIGVISGERVNNYRHPLLPNHGMPPPAVFRNGPPPSTSGLVPSTSGYGGHNVGVVGMNQGAYIPRQPPAVQPQQIRPPLRLPPQQQQRMQHPSLYGQPASVSSPVHSNGHPPQQQQPLNGGRNPNLITIPIQGHPGDPHGAPHPPQHHYQQHPPRQQSFQQPPPHLRGAGGHQQMVMQQPMRRY